MVTLLHLALLLSLSSPSTPLSPRVSRDVAREQLCPVRNDFAVAAAGQSCVKKCAQDGDCNNEKKLCLCDGLCGLSCIRPERECPELADPANGQVSLSGRHFQDEASYSCHEGFTLVGVSTLTCQASGRWSGVTPECQEWRAGSSSPDYCGSPNIVDNAVHNASSDQMFFSIDTSLSYRWQCRARRGNNSVIRCNPGYQGSHGGFSHSKCLFHNNSAVWWER